MNRTKQQGFTIIEVVLVLAIAGLVFLMVFLALPALYRNQRNEQRREDVNRIYSQIANYQKNNHGKPPFNADTGEFDAKFVSHYLDEGCTGERAATDEEAGGASFGGVVFEHCGPAFSDPDGTPYTVGHLQSTDTLENVTNTNHVIYFGARMICRGENAISEETTIEAAPNSFVVMTVLEGGSVYCVDNATRQTD